MRHKLDDDDFERKVVHVEVRVVRGPRFQRAEVRISEIHTLGCAGDLQVQVWEH